MSVIDAMRSIFNQMPEQISAPPDDTFPTSEAL